jgi:acid phosphatase (class A)
VIWRRALSIGLGVAALAAGYLGWEHRSAGPHFLTSSTAQFAAQLAAPPAPDSSATRLELDELLAMQAARTAPQVAAARADRKTRVQRFYVALGLGTDPPALPRLERLAERVEDDVRIYVRAAKDRYRRLRPSEIEPRIEPCIGDVRGDLSYPSGHAAFGWSMAYLLAQLVPERRAQLEARAQEFAGQRMICGVHFRSDLEAGRQAAQRLLAELEQVESFRTEKAGAASELRAALGLD